MKLFVAALAAVHASEEGAAEGGQAVAQAVVCPLGWEAGTDADECKPKNVEVNCGATEMTVTFPIDAVYFHGSDELSDTQKTKAMVDIVDASGDDCVDFEVNSEGKFEVKHSLTGCGTQATHDAENNQLVFTNSYIGDEAALTVDGILTTKVLSFKAQCTYSDQATVSVDDVTVLMGTNIAETVSDTGKYAFSMSTLDADGDALSADNQAEIGDQITLKITPDTELPSNVEFHIVNCVAAEGFTEDGNVDGKSYNIIEKGSCVSKLLEAQFDGDGYSNTDVSLDFNSFTFAAGDDQLDIKCDLKLCLSDDEGCYGDVQKQATDNECKEKYQRSNWFNALEPAEDDSAEEGGDDSAEEGGDDSAEEGGDDSAEEGGDDSAEEGGDDSAEEGGDDSAEEGGDDSAEEGGDDSAEERGDDSTEVGGDDSAEEGGTDSE